MKATNSTDERHAPPGHIIIEDRGSDVTLFIFAGAARKVAQLQPYEFRYLFRIHQSDYNLVFFRDHYRSFYQLTPDGSPGGLEFYSREVSSIISSLGSTIHVAMGTSMGASAALYFGARCNMDLVIGFSPGFPVPALDQWSTVWRRWADLRSLIRSPSGYLTDAVLAPVSRVLYRRLAHVVGRENVVTMIEAYKHCDQIPITVQYYSSQCATDIWMVSFLPRCPRIKLNGLPTSNHNSAGYLMARDQLFPTILDLIQSIGKPPAKDSARDVI